MRKPAPAINRNAANTAVEPKIPNSSPMITKIESVATKALPKPWMP